MKDPTNTLIIYFSLLSKSLPVTLLHVCVYENRIYTGLLIFNTESIDKGKTRPDKKELSCHLNRLTV